MAEQLDSFEFKAGRASKTPWEQWLNGKIWKLKRGEDYTSKEDSLVTSLRDKAKKRGLKARVYRDKEAGYIVVQAVKLENSATENGAATESESNQTTEEKPTSKGRKNRS